VSTGQPLEILTCVVRHLLTAKRTVVERSHCGSAA
jgi:hypothetical protein